MKSETEPVPLNISSTHVLHKTSVEMNNKVMHARVANFGQRSSRTDLRDETATDILIWEP